MAAVAHNPKFAKKVGIPQSVGKEFNKADKGKQFKRGGEMAESKKMVKKEVAFMKAKGAPKSMVKHEKAEVKDTGANKLKMFGKPAPAPKSAAKSDPGLKKSLSFARDITRGKPAPAAKPAAKKLGLYTDLIKKNDAKAAMQAKKSSAPAAKPAAPAPQTSSPAPKPNPKTFADPRGKTYRVPEGAPATPTPAPEQKTMAPAMKKGGKVCGMKAGGVKKELPTAKDLGSMNMKKGGRVKCMAGGGYVRAADGVTKKGKTKGKII